MVKHRINNLKLIKYNRRNGFTIIEALVATAVFAMTMTAIMGVFLAIIRLNERGSSVRRVQQNARFISEFIAREIRNGQINYSAYGASVPSPFTTTLHYITKDNLVASFELVGDDLFYHQTGETSAKINSEDIDIPNLKFYIRPITEATAQQPYVLMVMRVETNSDQHLAPIDVQTTISSRYYPR